MTLNVNISVNNPQLLNNNKIDATANREINLVDRPERAKVESSARGQREAKLKKQGRNPDGTVINRSGLQFQYRPDELAANRKKEDFPSIGHAWLFQDETLFDYSVGYVSFASGRLSGDRTVFRRAKSTWNLASGSGNSWTTFDEKYRDDYLQVNLQFTGTQGSGLSFVELYQGTVTNVIDYQTQEQIIGFPAGKGNFVFVHVYDMLQNKRTTVAQYRSPLAGELENYPPSQLSPDDRLTTGELYSVTENATNEREYICYVVSNNGLRQISIPAKLQEVIDFLWPLPTITGTPRTSYNWSVWPGSSATITINWIQYTWSFNYSKIQYLRDNYDSIVLPYASGDFIQISPYIFQNIQNGYSFTDESFIDAETELRVPIADIRSGGYSNFDDNGEPLEGYEYPTFEPMYNLNSEFKYGVGKTKGYVPWFTDWSNGPKPVSSNKMTLTMDPNRQPAIGSAIYSNPATYQQERMYISTDGAKSNYCITMMKELGFSEADLKP